MEPHVNQDCSYLTQFLKEDHQNSTWKSLHVSHNIVCSQICHKHIHIMGWKDQTSKEIETCGKFVSLSSCCEKATAGMLRAFPVHFVPLQSKSTQCNMNSSRVATENCIKCGFSYETDCCRNYCEESFWMNFYILCRCWSLTMVDLTECCMLTVHRSHTLIRIPHWMLHINCAQEPHLNQDLIISHSFWKKIIKIYLKIPACESQCCLQSNLSQTHSYHGVKRPNKQRNSNLWEVCFSSAAVVRKLLLGCWGPFPVHFILLQSNSTQPNMHDSHADKEHCIK